MRNDGYDLVVIGGGASGMMAALAAADVCGGLKIAVLERLARVGKKLMATGNGRCNLTNMNASRADYHGDVDFILPAMRRFPPQIVIRRFESLGVTPFIEPDGRVYPLSGQASSVLDVMRMAMAERGIEEICGCEAASLAFRAPFWRVAAKDGRVFQAGKVIAATGGLSAPSGSAGGYKLLQALGHRLNPTFPALVQLKCDPALVRPLKGIRIDAAADIMVDGKPVRSERGDVLFTEYGLSGLAMFQLSRAAASGLRRAGTKRVTAVIHVLPWSGDEAKARLGARRADFPDRALENFLTGTVNKRLGQTLIRRAVAKPLSEPTSQLDDGDLERLAAILTGWEIGITGTMGFDQAQVTAGGIAADGFDPETMESRIAPGVYAAGEVLDVDGDCGGFNLQWAWASALLAGESAARSALRGEGRK